MMTFKNLTDTDRALLVWLHQLEGERAAMQRTLSRMPTHVEFFEARTGQSADLIQIWNRLQDLDTLINNLITAFEKSKDIEDERDY